MRMISLVFVLLVGGFYPAARLAQPAADVAITFPPPVFVIGGDVEIVGTANAPAQESYFIEYRPLADDLTPRDGEDTIWLPATLPQRGVVIDDVLTVWDTTSAPDGLYALRLTVNRTSGAALRNIVAPVRVDNSALETFAPLDEDAAINNALLALTATAAAVSGEAPVVATPDPAFTPDPLQPTPTEFGVGIGVPTAQVVVVSNLREGDSTLFAIKAGLAPGTMLEVLGRSSRGNNWLLIETPDGERGWVAPSVVNLRGSILDIPPVDPPAPPITPTPTASPIPPLPDAEMVDVRVDRELVEGENFQIVVDYRNSGSQFLPENVLFCNVEPMNVSVDWLVGNLQPGASGGVAIPLRLDEGGGSDITIICRLDMNEFVDEANEGNNSGRVTVRLNDDDD